MSSISIPNPGARLVARMVMLMNRHDPLVSVSVETETATFTAQMPASDLELRVWRAFEAADWYP